MATTETGVLGANSTKLVQSYAERAARLFSDRDETNSDISELFKEAKEAGLDAKILRRAITLARKDTDAMAAEQEMLDTYFAAIVELPLFAGIGTKAAPKPKKAKKTVAPAEPAKPEGWVAPTEEEAAFT